MKKLLIITVLFVLGFVSSCKKDEVAVVTKTKKELLTAKTWVVSTVSALGGDGNVYKRGNKPADNLYDLDKVSLTFKADGSLTGVDNNGKAVTSAKWSFSTDESKLIISNTGIVGLDGELTIVQLTETVLEIKGKVTVQGITADGTIKAIPQ
jgi:hypothetical protein